jgi:hypothetical protein
MEKCLISKNLDDIEFKPYEKWYKQEFSKGRAIEYE